jgi:hypothetical protein
MKRQYDFRSGRRGAVLRGSSGKTRITIRIDDDVLQWFRSQVHKAGGGSYQTLINDALRSFAESTEANLADTLRRVLREELPSCGVRRKAGLTRRGGGRPPLASAADRHVHPRIEAVTGK